MRTLTVNGKLYKARAFDFNTICDLEELGISLEQAQKKPLSMVRAYFSLCTGASAEYAGKEMEAHLVNGGKIEDIMTVMGEEMQDSDFFRNLNKDSAEEATETQTTPVKKTMKKQ